jgi:predicted hydrocarbon binding protein
VISRRLMKAFVTAVRAEIDIQTLPAVLAGSGITCGDMEALETGLLDELYARFQRALRLFYGREARGMLVRIGRGVWDRWVGEARLKEKTDLEITRWLPVPARRRRVLNLVAARLLDEEGGASVHTLDINFHLVDRVGAATIGQKEEHPICFITLGLIQQALLWATGKEADVKEISCRAIGSPVCEFKVSFGG